MNHGSVIEISDSTWWKGIIFSAIGITLIIITGKFSSDENKNLIANITGFFLLLVAIFIHVYQAAIGEWNIKHSLPLHLCNMSGLLSGIALLVRKQTLYEFLLYWGIPGATYSLLTPDMTLGSDGWYSYDYYISHAGIILSAIYLTTVLKMYPRKNSWFKIFFLTQIFILLVAFADYAIGANYMFLVEKPEVNNPLIIGAWPLYILGFEIAGFIHFYIVYFIFKKRKIDPEDHTSLTTVS